MCAVFIANDGLFRFKIYARVEMFVRKKILICVNGTGIYLDRLISDIFSMHMSLDTTNIG